MHQALAVGCEHAATVGGQSIRVEAPVVGRVIVGDDTQFIDPENPALFSGMASRTSDVTFISDDSRVTLLDVSADEVDFTGFISDGSAVRGALVPIFLRAEPSEHADVVVIANGQKFSAARDGDPETIEVPRGHTLTAVAVWEDEGEIRWTIRDLGFAAELDGHRTVLKPTVRPESELVVHVEPGPAGWMTAELVYRGIRTGLSVGEGRVDASVATVVATTGTDDPDLSLWIHVRATELSPETRTYTIGASVPMNRSSVALPWIDQFEFSPPIRGVEAALPIESSGSVWSVDTLGEQAQLFEVSLEALGVCREVNWQVTGPMAGDTVLPTLDTENVLSAPLIRAHIQSVERQGLDWDTWVSQAISPDQLPRYTGLARNSGTVGYWRRARQCDNHPDQGLYAAYPLDNPDCKVDGTTDVYLIDRCGAVVRIKPGTRGLDEMCGEVSERLFSPLQGAERGIEQLDGGILRIGQGFTAVDLVPLSSAQSPAPTEWRGHWFRYEMTEQDFLLGDDGLEIAQNDPVRIAVGGAEGGPWLHIRADGHGQSTARFATFDFVFTGESPSTGVKVVAPGCQSKDRHMQIFEEGESLAFYEKIFAERSDEFRLRIYRFQR